MAFARPQEAITLRRVMIFIDGSNFLAGYGEFQQEQNKKLTIDYPSFKQVLLQAARGDKRHIIFEHIKTNYYASEGVPNEVKSAEGIDVASAVVKVFTETLRQNHVRVILKSKIRGKEKGVDIALAVDLLAMAYSNAYDYAIIVGGDADFISAIDEVKRFGKIVYVASFRKRFNKELMTHVV
jgi:uncharacterized LabA/DUF88 family protein